MRFEKNRSCANSECARISGRFRPWVAAVFAAVPLFLGSSTLMAQVRWPEEQLLPSFPSPAPTQDLILLRGSSMTWEAEGAALGHGTGRREGDGWLCQVNIDEPGRHMVYGPYVTSLPEGRNTAHFRMKIDNNTTNDAHQVTIDVRDSTSGTVLASQEITRKQFGVAGDYVSFALPFEIKDPGHAIELRVYWVGGAYIKVDSIRVDRGPEDELVLFASLKGIVNLTKPRIFSYEGDAFAEGKHTWLESLGLKWTEHTDNWSLIGKYKGEIKGLVVYDEKLPDTMNLATTIAGREKALVVSPSLLPRLLAAPYNFKVIEDLRGRFANKLSVYDHLYSALWPNLTHRVIMGLSPVLHKASAREYAVALGAAVIWLDPLKAGESEMLDKFLSSMGPGNSYMGWWPEEGPGVERGSRHGIPTVASDYATNLTLHSGMPRTVNVKPVPAKPILKNKFYVAFVLSDGDNLQYVEHLMRKLWNDPGRGKVPIGWTVSPAMLDAMPGALEFYYASGTDNDNLISGPSGWGYGYPNFWKDETTLEDFVRKTDDYARRSGLRVVTIWNTITGGIDSDVGARFAKSAPSLLGLTAQNTGGGLTIYGDKLPGFALSCNYCTDEQAIKDHIASAAKGWDGKSPRFILIQAQPWKGVTPTTFNNVKESLNEDYVVVRPDNWFQLLRQTNGIPIEPINPIANGTYRLVNKASGQCVAISANAADPRSVVQMKCADDDAQRFRVVATERGYAKLLPVTDEAQALSVEGGPDATDEGPKIVLSEDVGGANQEWQPVWESDKYHHLIARNSDRCLDVPNGRDEEGLQLQQWTCNNTVAQAFEFADPTWQPPPDPDPELDGGTPPSDAGTPDAGRPPEDGGTQKDDAGRPPTTKPEPTQDGRGSTNQGCSCSAPSGAASATPLAALGLLLLLGRRRRFESPR